MAEKSLMTGVDDLKMMQALNEERSRLQLAMQVAKMKLDMLREFCKSEMQEGHDYGTIPGTPKPTLLLPGAQKLQEFARLEPLLELLKDETVRDFEKGHFAYSYRCSMKGTETGDIEGICEGTCSSYESKYRYRWVFPAQVPKGVDLGTLVKRNTRAGIQYRVENEDRASLDNTIRKLSQKRAYVGSVIQATRTSEFFTQDLEDGDYDRETGEVKGGAEKSDEAESVKPKVNVPSTAAAAAPPKATEKPTAAAEVPKPEVLFSNQPKFKKFHAKVDDLGLNHDFVKSKLKEKWGVESSKDLLVKDFDAILLWLEELAGLPKATPAPEPPQAQGDQTQLNF